MTLLAQAGRLRFAIVGNDISGLLHFRRPIIAELRRRNVECWVIGPIRDGVFATRGQVEASLSELGVRCMHWDLTRRGVNPFRELVSLIQLCAIYMRLKPDLVHHVTPKPVLYGGIAGRCLGLRVVNAVSGLGYVYGAKTWRRRVLRSALDRLNRLAHGGRRMRVIFQNENDLATLVDSGAVSAKRARIIHGSGVDPSLWCPRGQLTTSPVVLVACRMLIDKGVHDVVAAARILRLRGISLDLRLAGTADPGNPNSIPNEQLQSWHDEGIATWLGPVGNMLECWRSARIACLPTYYPEGVPKALIEAASCGLPLVTTDMPGCRDICRNGENGILVRPRDPESIADALALLLGEHSRCMSMGEAGRRHVISSFSIARVVREHMAVYDELIGAFPHSGRA